MKPHRCGLVSVCLLGPAGEWQPSMTRYTERLVGSGVDRDVRVWTAPAPGLPARGTGPCNAARRWRGRWIEYPWSASRASADVYHVTDHSYAYLVAGLPRRRSIVTCHDLLLLRAASERIGFTPHRRSLLQFRFSTSFIRRAAVVVAVSEATKQDVLRFFDLDPKRVEVIPNGVAETFRPLAEAERANERGRLGIGDQIVLLEIGTSIYKNLGTGVRALRRLRDDGVDAVLLHVGGVPDENIVALADRLGLGGHVRMIGRIDDERLVRIYNAADVLLFPSMGEGFGWPPLEAMACGLPVVASDIAPLREVMGDAGLFADPHEASAWAESTATILHDAGRRQALLDAGFARAQLHSWRRARSSYDLLYRSVALRGRD